jgi:hypothetical protein
MTELSSSDIHFLVALLASEEASASELKSLFDVWGVKPEIVKEIFVSLMKDGTIGVTNYIDEKFIDITLEQSLVLTENWLDFISSPYQIYLTDPGFKRWDIDDWGISTDRAKFLMFSNNGSAIHV